MRSAGSSLLLAAAMLWSAIAVPCRAVEAGSEAHFAWVSYAGRDPAAAEFPATATEYRNPIIPGFQPDPSIVRVGGDYYLTNSSFAFFPGLPIYHSRDLVNWQQVGNAIDRPGQLEFAGLGIARAIFAPTLRWHRGVFYIVGTCADCGGNFIISASKPAGPWSDPVWLKSIEGIDPDLFFDGDGKAWIANNGPPREQPLYAGHRAIWLQQFDLETRTMRGARSVIVNGGTDIDQHPVWIEGPHLVKRGLKYYLIAAEGGTAGDHSEVVFRSDRVEGPYVPATDNPILTQRDLDPARPYPIAAAGHADFVRAADGRWWSVFLATRPYAANLSNLGRETFLLPVQWENVWPQILPPRTPVPHVVPRPSLPVWHEVDRSEWRDAFHSRTLAPDWEMIRTPTENWYRMGAGGLTVRARAVSISGSANPSFLGKRQRHADAVVETEMHYQPERNGDCAGLAAFADERHHYFVGLCETPKGPTVVATVRNGADDPENGRVLAAMPYVGALGGAIRLHIGARGAVYDFSYALADSPWQSLLSNADGTVLASEPTNQFTGALIGVYAVRGALAQRFLLEGDRYFHAGHSSISGMMINHTMNSSHRVARDDFPVPVRAQLWNSLLGGEIDVVNAEALLVAVGPFVVVEQAPEKVALHRIVPGHCAVQVREVIAQEHHSIGVVDSAGVRDVIRGAAVLRDVDGGRLPQIADGANRPVDDFRSDIEPRRCHARKGGRLFQDGVAGGR
jgi:alpha-N-arabinofuranosidase